MLKSISTILICLTPFLHFTARNAVIVIGAAGILAIFEYHNLYWFTPTGKIQGGLPKFQVPQFSIHEGNVTVTTNELFSVSNIYSP